VLTILLDENINGYAEYLSRFVPTSLPVFTISDIHRLRSEREYVEALVAKLLECLMDADNLRGAGRLYLP
jgi:hypothetical protein